VIAFDVTYKLHDVVQDRIVLTEQALARVSIDRSPQRFANVRAARDAEARAAKVVAEQIRSRLASFFLTRT
jgi:LPS-assembly lipoprotein